MSEDFRTKSQLREDRLEREHNDPTPAYFEECSGYGRCDKLTEPTRNDELCSECMLPYGKNGDQTVEYLQNQISDLESKLKDPFHLNCQLIEDTRIGLEKKVEEQAARIAELTRHRRQARESIYYWQGRHKEQAARIAELETELKLAPLKEQLDRFGKDIAAEQERIANLDTKK